MGSGKKYNSHIGTDFCHGGCILSIPGLKANNTSFLATQFQWQSLFQVPGAQQRVVKVPREESSKESDCYLLAEQMRSVLLMKMVQGK